MENTDSEILLRTVGFTLNPNDPQRGLVVAKILSDTLLNNRAMALAIEPYISLALERMTDSERNMLAKRVSLATRVPFADDGTSTHHVDWTFSHGEATGKWMVKAVCNGSSLFWTQPEGKTVTTPSRSEGQPASWQVASPSLDDLEKHLSSIKYGESVPPTWLISQARQVWGRALGIL